MTENNEAAKSGYAQDATHYQVLQQQPIEIMQRLMTKEQFFGYCWGTIIAYVLRCGQKDEPMREMQKTAQYATWAADALGGNMINPRTKLGINIWSMSDDEFLDFTNRALAALESRGITQAAPCKVDLDLNKEQSA